MAERVNIEAERRLLIGKKAKQLRRVGKVPAVIYGQQEPVSIQLDNLTLRRALRTAGTTTLIDIAFDDGKRTVLAREIQTHVTRGDLLHVDFYEVNLTEMVEAEAALVTIGMSAPEEDGEGVTTQLLYSVQIEALPDALVSEFIVDLTRIETPDDVLYIRDLTVPEGVSILNDPDTPIAKFDYLREEEEVEEIDELESILEPAADEVEVVAKGKAASEEEEFEE